MPLSAQDYAALSRRPDMAAALNYASQGARTLQQGLSLSEQKRAAREQEQLELNRQEERNRSAEEQEEQARNREATRTAEKLRDVRLKTLGQMHKLFEAGFDKEARELGRLAGMEAGETTAEATKRSARQEYERRMKEAKAADEAEEKQFQEDAAVQAEYDAATPQTAPSKEMVDPSRGISPEQAMSLNNFLTQQAGQAMQDIQAVEAAAPPQQPQMQGPPPQQMMAPPGGLPPQMMQPQMQAPVQQPAQPAPQQAPMPGAMPGMLPIQMDPREVQRVITEEKIATATVQAQDYFTKQKASAPPQEQKVLDAMIESAPELARAYGGDYDAMMKDVAKGFHTKPIVDRILAREKMEASERNARRMSTGRGTKQDVGNYDKGRKMVTERARVSGLQKKVDSHNALGEALIDLGSGNPKREAKALKALAKAREDGRLSDQDMRDLMGKKSWPQEFIDTFSVGAWGGMAPKDRSDFVKAVRSSVKLSTVALGKLKAQSQIEADNAMERGPEFGRGARHVFEALFSGIKSLDGEKKAPKKKAPTPAAKPSKPSKPSKPGSTGEALGF